MSAECAFPRCRDGCRGHVAPAPARVLVTQNWIAGRVRGQFDAEPLSATYGGPDARVGDAPLTRLEEKTVTKYEAPPLIDQPALQAYYDAARIRRMEEKRRVAS